MLQQVRRPVGTTRFAEIVAQANDDRLWVVPACLDPAQKYPCIEWKALQERRPTDDEISEWIRRFPHRNGCYITGPLLGRFIVDIDDEIAAQWAAARGFPKTQTARSRRGFHLHFKYPEFKVATTAGAIRKHVDTRGEGGIAVAVGSIHASGFRYAWVPGRSPQDLPVAKAPYWLLDWLHDYAVRRERLVHSIDPPRSFNGTIGTWARRAIDSEIAELVSTPNGSRNHALARCSFKLGQICAAGEADVCEIRETLLAVVERWPEFEKSRSSRYDPAANAAGEL